MKRCFLQQTTIFTIAVNASFESKPRYPSTVWIGLRLLNIQYIYEVLLPDIHVYMSNSDLNHKAGDVFTLYT